MIALGVIVSMVYLIGCIYNLYLIDYIKKTHIVFYSDINSSKVFILTAGSFITSNILYKYLTDNSRKL